MNVPPTVYTHTENISEQFLHKLSIYDSNLHFCFNNLAFVESEEWLGNALLKFDWTQWEQSLVLMPDTEMGTPCFSRGDDKRLGRIPCRLQQRRIHDFDGRISRALTGPENWPRCLITPSQNRQRMPERLRPFEPVMGRNPDAGEPRGEGGRGREEGKKGIEAQKRCRRRKRRRGGAVLVQWEPVQHDLHRHLCQHMSKRPGQTWGEMRSLEKGVS